MCLQIASHLEMYTLVRLLKMSDFFVVLHNVKQAQPLMTSDMLWTPPMCSVEKEQWVLTCNGQIFSLPHFHFQFRSVNISTILNSKLKLCVLIWRLVFFAITWDICFLGGI